MHQSSFMIPCDLENVKGGEDEKTNLRKKITKGEKRIRSPTCPTGNPFSSESTFFVTLYNQSFDSLHTLICCRVHWDSYVIKKPPIPCKPNSPVNRDDNHFAGFRYQMVPPGH